MYFLITGKTADGKQGFAYQSFYKSVAWGNCVAVSVVYRDPSAIFGIREIAHFDGCAPAGIRVNELLSLIDGEGKWHNDNSCPAKIAQNLGWI